MDHLIIPLPSGDFEVLPERRAAPAVRVPVTVVRETRAPHATGYILTGDDAAVLRWYLALCLKYPPIGYGTRLTRRADGAWYVAHSNSCD